jgi:hypothetical protein
MRQALRAWAADADTRQYIADFGLQSQLDLLDYQDGRTVDLYFSLVGELFDSLRDAPADPRDWATLGNAFSQISQNLQDSARSDALFFSAAAFYSGGFSASAYLTMRRTDPADWSSDSYRACYDLLARPREPTSQRVDGLLTALREDRPEAIAQALDRAVVSAQEALAAGPEEWVADRIYASLLTRFSLVNLRSVLTDETTNWGPLVDSFLDRTPPVWDFFPSQIEAIRAGLLTSSQTYSLQMPTGAGKTALTETLLFGHLTTHPADAAVLLVPYRALARELRNSLGRRLSAIGLPTRSIYGGTVPSQEDAQDLDSVRAFIATPEAFTGVLGRSTGLLPRLSLAICDEGHLLDGGARGIGLELLLARLRGRTESPPRVVFVSAIVPNIEEVNTWLGGSEATVVKSDFRPSDAEYAVLRPSGSGRNMQVGLEAHPVSTSLQAHTLPNFLQVSDFEFTNPATGRRKTYPYSSFKTQAIAAARKSLALGTVAVFAATKTGDQGVVGLANELIQQVESGLPLPHPAAYIADADLVAPHH